MNNNKKQKYSLEDFLDTKSATGASFNFNNEQIAFLNSGTSTNQIYLMSCLNENKKIEQLTDYEDTVSFVSFSPTKNELLFGKAEKGNERVQFFMIDIATRLVRSITNDTQAIHKFGGWSNDGQYITYSSNERNGSDFDVYIMDIQKESSHCVFKENGWCDSMGFSPSGKKIIVRKRHTFQSHDFYIVDTESGINELLTIDKEKGVRGYPQWMPNESGFFFTNNNMRDFDGVCFFNIATKKEEYVLTPEMDIEGLSLSYSGQLLAVMANENGTRSLTIYNTDNLQPIANQSFPKGMISNPQWSKDDSSILFTFSGPTKNANIWIWSKKENVCRQITDTSHAVPGEILTEPELFHYSSFDGLQIPVFIFLPKTDGDSKKIPAIVHIHGGPEDQYRPGFNSLIQYFVYCGYAVVAPNIRGSSGYGKKYLALDDIEKRMDSITDLEYLHKFLEKDGRIDTKKIALMGTSYGGYMTLAGLTFQPNLWAAGIDVVGFSNLVSFLENTSSWRRTMREAEYGYLDKDRKLLESISPLNFIENIKAPLLIIHGANDPRVPLSESEQIFTKLKESSKKVELLIYQDEGHGLKKLKNRINAYTKIVHFLNSV